MKKWKHVLLLAALVSLLSIGTLPAAAQKQTKEQKQAAKANNAALKQKLDSDLAAIFTKTSAASTVVQTDRSPVMVRITQLGTVVSVGKPDLLTVTRYLHHEPQKPDADSSSRLGAIANALGGLDKPYDGPESSACLTTTFKMPEASSQLPKYCDRNLKLNAAHYIGPADKLLITALSTEPAKDQIYIKLLVYDPNSEVAPTPGFFGEAEFQFPQGYLATADARQIADAIGTVLNVQPAAAPAPAPVAAPPEPPLAPIPPPPPPPAPPQTVELGMTPDQVTAALGSPSKQVNLGKKTIFIYDSLSLKIIFLNGKVTDVQ